MQKVRNNPSFGSNLRSLRKAAGMTQEQVVIKLQLLGHDITRSIYSQFECGVYNIRIDELIALKHIFGVNYDDFFLPLEKDQSVSTDHMHV